MINNVGIRLSKGTVGELISLLNNVDKETMVACCGDAKMPIVYYLDGHNTMNGKQCVTIDYDVIQDRDSDNDIPVIPFEFVMKERPKTADEVTMNLSYEFFCMVFPKITSLLEGKWDDNPEGKQAMVDFIKEIYHIKFNQDFINKANTLFELFRDEDVEENKEEE